MHAFDLSRKVKDEAGSCQEYSITDLCDLLLLCDVIDATGKTIDLEVDSYETIDYNEYTIYLAQSPLFFWRLFDMVSLKFIFQLSVYIERDMHLSSSSSFNAPLRNFLYWIVWGTSEDGPSYFSTRLKLPALILLKHGQLDAVELEVLNSLSCLKSQILRSESECEVREYAAEEQWMLMEAESCEICALCLKACFEDNIRFWHNRLFSASRFATYKAALSIDTVIVKAVVSRKISNSAT
ncbi:hypothetical protein Tco_1318427 [Tanacetum coccineum]